MGNASLVNYDPLGLSIPYDSHSPINQKKPCLGLGFINCWERCPYDECKEAALRAQSECLKGCTNANWVSMSQSAVIGVAMYFGPYGLTPVVAVTAADFAAGALMNVFCTTRCEEETAAALKKCAWGAVRGLL